MSEALPCCAPPQPHSLSSAPTHSLTPSPGPGPSLPWRLLPAVLMSPLAPTDAPPFHPWRPQLGTSPSPSRGVPRHHPCAILFFHGSCGIRCQPGSAQHQRGRGTGGQFLITVWFWEEGPQERLGRAGPGLTLLPTLCSALTKLLPPQTSASLSHEGEGSPLWAFEDKRGHRQSFRDWECAGQWQWVPDSPKLSSRWVLEGVSRGAEQLCRQTSVKPALLSHLPSELGQLALRWGGRLRRALTAQQRQRWRWWRPRRRGYSESWEGMGS